MAAIELQRIVKRFPGKGGRPVQTLHGVDLAVADGEFVVLVGPSGCGKSTLLRIVAGLETPSEGRVLIGGRDLTGAAPGSRGLAMVFQSYALYPHMTVRQNLGFGMRMRGVPAATVAAKLERAVAMLQLAPYLDRKPGELSGGQCQRVAIGRAIVQEPGAFLFDEPLSNLDAELRLRMRLEIAALHRELGTTMLYVTHDQVEAMTLAQRIVVLRDGRVEQAGAPLALYAAPANTFVAGFIGSPAMNLLPARWAAGGMLTLPGGARLAAPPLGEGVAVPAAGAAVQVGIRPEHLQPAADGPLRLVVQAVERLGASSFAYGRLAGEEGPAAAGGGGAGIGHADPGTAPAPRCAELRGADAAALRVGQVLALAPRPGQLHLFDGDGRRIGAACDGAAAPGEIA
jgi:ABC-type sugar transport system ATPase subunit